MKNIQLKHTWITSHYLLRFKENSTWHAKELVIAVKKDHRVAINKWTPYNAKQQLMDSCMAQCLTITKS